MTATKLEQREEFDSLRRRFGELTTALAEQRKVTARLRERMVDDPSRETTARLTDSLNEEGRLTTEFEQVKARQAGLTHELGGGNGGGFHGGRYGLEFYPEAEALLDRYANSTAQLGGQAPVAAIPRDRLVAWLGRVPRAQGDGVTDATPGMHRTDSRGVVPAPEPPGFLQLIPSGVTDALTIDYVAEIAAGDLAAEIVEPGEIKPLLAVQYEDRTNATASVAAATKINRNSADDADGFQQLVETSLRRALRLRLEREVFAGDGEKSDRPGIPGITGLTNITGVASIPAGAGGTLEQILDGVVAVEASGGSANLAVLALSDWRAMAGLKDTTGQYLFSPAGILQTVWGLTVSRTTAFEGGGFVADSSAMQLLVRLAAEIRVSDSDQDDFLRNRLTVRAETRAAFIVRQPSLIALLEPESD
jgi:hypothetical protein